MKNKIHFAWFILIGLCITVGLGKAALNNTAGLFVTPISEELGILKGNLTVYLSISSIITMIFLPVGGKLMAKYDARAILIIATILQAGAFAMFGFMSSVWGWYIFAIPLAVGGVFITVIAGPVMIERWFVKKNGMALGIMTAIGGLMGAFIQPITGNLISSFGWRSSYFIIGIAVIVILVPTILFLVRNSPSEKGLLPYGETPGTDKEKSKKVLDGILFSDAKKSAAILYLGLFFFMVTAISSFSVHIPTYLGEQGYGVKFAGNAMAATMFGVFIGSLVFGYLSDKIGVKKTSIFAMILGLLSIVLLLVFPDYVAVILIALMLFGFVTASIGTIAPAMTSALFGSRDYSRIYSTASMGLALASIIALPLYGYISDFTGSYVPALYVIIIMLALNILFIIGAFHNKKKMVQSGLWGEETQ